MYVLGSNGLRICRYRSRIWIERIRKIDSMNANYNTRFNLGSTVKKVYNIL